MYLKSNDDEKELTQYLSENHLGTKIIFTLYKTQNTTEYPYNKLRNLSIKKVKTSHYWVMDMDIWPATNLYHTLLNLDNRYLNDEYLAIIIPAFEFKKDMNNCNDFENCVKQLISYINGINE